MANASARDDNPSRSHNKKEKHPPHSHIYTPAKMSAHSDKLFLPLVPSDVHCMCASHTWRRKADADTTQHLCFRVAVRESRQHIFTWSMLHRPSAILLMHTASASAAAPRPPTLTVTLAERARVSMIRKIMVKHDYIVFTSVAHAPLSKQNTHDTAAHSANIPYRMR